MKKNLPNDGLDKFLKNSFEDYEENPSNDVWENISKGLKEEPATAATGTTGTVVSIGMKWWLASAASILLCVGFAQYYYFNNKIEEISQRVDNQEIIVNDILENKKEIDSQSLKKPQSENTITPLKENPNSNFSDDNKVVQTNEIEPSEKKSTKNLKTKKLPVVHSQTTTSQEVVAKQQVRNFVEEFPSHEYNEGGNSSFVGTESNNQNLGQSNSINQIDGAVESPISNNEILEKQREKISIEELTTSINFLDTNRELNFQIPSVNKIVPISQLKNGITIMPFAGYYQSREKIDYLGMTPNPRNIPSHHIQNLNNDFVGNIDQYGLKLGFSLRGNLNLEVGLAYRVENYELTQNILTKYRYRQGQGSNRSDDFEFVFNTGDRIIEFEIDTKKDSNEPISGDEEIPIVIEIERIRTNFSIPLKLNYVSQVGNWMLGGGLGAAFNIPILNELEIEGRVDHKKLETKNDRPEIRKGEKSGIGIDAIASLNFGYKLTENLSIEASPTMIYQLKGNQRIDRFVKDLSVSSFGGDVGLKYSF